MKPPYPAEYWDNLTDQQKINDLVHKFAQLRGLTYPQAYMYAQSVIDAPGIGSYAVRLDHAGKAQDAIAALIEDHVGRRMADAERLVWDRAQTK